MRTIRRHYPSTACPFCGQPLTTAGAARVGHLRAHVARGEAAETDGEATEHTTGYRTTYSHTPAFDFYTAAIKGQL